MNEPVFNITNEMLRLISDIDEFKGAWKALGNLAPERLHALKKVATIESVGSSTRIEGVKLTDKEIMGLLSGLETHSFRSRDEEEVVGYAESINLVFESFDDISLTENHIKQLHRVLLKYSSKDIRHRGEYKKLNNHVETFDTHGKSLGIIFHTASPFETPMKMESIIQWTNKKFDEKELHSLLIIAIFVVCFLAIHPFQDGNGRLSRILTTLLLLKRGYLFTPYSSLESIIEQNKEGYYLALRQAQKSLDTDYSGLNVWLLFFLNCLKKQKDNLTRKLENERLMVQLPKLSLQILETIKNHGSLKISDIQSITQANRNTIKIRLKELVSDGYLKQEGKGKGTLYTLGNRSI